MAALKVSALVWGSCLWNSRSNPLPTESLLLVEQQGNRDPHQGSAGGFPRFASQLCHLLCDLE